MNTFFKHKESKLGTWRSPGERYFNQIDFIIGKQNRKGEAIQVKAYRKAEIASDHNLLTAKIKITLKKKRRPKRTFSGGATLQSNRGADYDLTQLDEVRNSFRNTYEPLSEKNTDIEKDWNNMKETLKRITETHVPKLKRPEYKSWMSKETREQLKEMARIRMRNIPEEIKESRRKYQICVRKDKDREINLLCEKIEEFQEHNNSKGMFNVNKRVNKKFKSTPITINDKDGIEQYTEEGIKVAWGQFGSDLFKESTNIQTKDKSKCKRDQKRDTINSKGSNDSYQEACKRKSIWSRWNTN